MHAGSFDFDLKLHFSVVVFPFVHDAFRRGGLTALGRRWQPWWGRVPVEELTDNLCSTDYFLPYLQNLLYPEASLLKDVPQATWSLGLKRAAQMGVEDHSASLGRDAVLRWTLREEHRTSFTKFRAISRTGEHVHAKIDWIDALLFPTGLGFLLAKVGLDEPEPRFSQLLRLHRAVVPVHGEHLMPLQWEESNQTTTWRDVLDWLIEGFQPHLPMRPRFTGVDGCTCYSDSQHGRAFGRQCHLLSFANVQTAEHRDELPSGVFSSGEDRLLFEFANVVLLGQSVDNPVWTPSKRQAERYSRDHVWSLWQCWRAMFLKESLVFLATEDLPFTRRTLPRTIENDYLPLYLFTLFQKFQLYRFANDLMHEVACVDQNLRNAKGLMHRFVEFRNRYWLPEVTRKPQGGELYRMLHQGLEVTTLYQMVTTNVKEAKEYYQELWDRRLELLAKSIGFVAGPAVALFSGISVFFRMEAPWAMLLTVLGVVATSGLLLAYLWIQPPKRRNPFVERAPMLAVPLPSAPASSEPSSRAA